MNVYTKVYWMKYLCECGEKWEKNCTCVCDDICKCGASVSPGGYGVLTVFHDHDLEANAPKNGRVA